MNRRRAVTSAAAIVTAGAVVALTFPALAGTSPSSDPDGSSSAANAGAPPQVLAAIARDLRLTTAQAQSRLDREQRANQAVQTLRSQSGDAYAGAWLSADGSAVTVAVTDAALADEVRAADAEPKIVTRSATDLDEVKQALDTNAEAAADAVPGWYVDVASNTVVVLARPEARVSAEEFAADSGVPAAVVRVVETAEAPKPLFDVVGGDAFTVGNGRCSIGFAVTTGFVTAGHCGQPGTETQGVNGADQGTFVASSFPGDDFGVVEVNGDWVPQPAVNDYEGGSLPVAGSTEAAVGATVCRSGSTTGLHCGVIQAKNATVNYAEGTVTGLTRTDVCAEPGDSGGAWISDDQAQGITSGGSGDCTQGGVTFFQPVNEVLERNGLTLVTTANAGTPPTEEPTVPPTEEPTAPPTEEPTTPPTEEPTVPPTEEPTAEPTPTATTPPAADCTGDADIERQGGLAGPGARRDVRFRATAGQHVACLTGPATADFDLYLQRQSGGRWVTVARATGTSATEVLTFDGSAGRYRYRVASADGAGTFTLRFSVN